MSTTQPTAPDFRPRVIALLLVVLVAPFVDARAASQTDRTGAFRIEYSWLRDAAFQERPQQRLLNIATREIESGDYSEAFEVLHEILRQPTDSFLLPREGESIRGVRATVTGLLESLPLPAIVQWDTTCKGPATREYRQAVRDGSQTALEDVIRRYPCSSVAADAHLLRATSLASRGEFHAARSSLAALKSWQQKGILGQRQHAAIRKLAAMFEHRVFTELTDESSEPSGSLIHSGRAITSNPTWVWKKSPWSTPGAPNELPRPRASMPGNQFGHRAGSQAPILLRDAIVIRTPAGIARVNRDTGRQQWFLPFESVVRGSRSNESKIEELLEFMPTERNRLACDNGTIIFLDGVPASPLRPQGGFQPSQTHQAAPTRIVAIRNHAQPAVLWWSNGISNSALNNKKNGLEPTYTFRRFDSPATPTDVVRPSSVAQPGSAHQFHSSPVTQQGRVFVTSQFYSLTYLNCLSATNGELMWQQPLTWPGDKNEDDESAPAVVGGIVDDVVVCLLTNGAVAGCRISNGTIAWMQSILVAPKADERSGAFALSAQAVPEFVPPGGIGSQLGDHWLQIAGDSVVCGRRGSHAVFCINGLDGHLQWSASGVASDGITSGQVDSGCVGIAENNVVLVGYSHCRALRLDDGSQAWVRPTGHHGGRIAISGSQIYVGLTTDRLLTIDGVSGRILRSQACPTGQMGPAWAVDTEGIVDASAWRVTTRSWTHDEDGDGDDSIRPQTSKVVGRPSAVPEAVLSPEVLGDVDAQLAFAAELLNQGNRQQAELVLLNMDVGTAKRSDVHLQQEQLLVSIRQPVLIPGFETVQPVQLPDKVTFTESPSEIAGFRLNDFSEFRRRHGGSRLRTTFPWWFRHPLITADVTSIATELQSNTTTTPAKPRIGLIDVERAIEFASADVSSLQFPINHSRQDAWENPGLIVIQRDNLVGIASVFNTDPFAPLWLRKMPADRDGEILALTSRRFVIADNAGMTVVHPLTGALLWDRQWDVNDETRHLSGQYFKVYNTRKHIVLMTSLGTACVVLNAEDGAIIRCAGYSPGGIARVVGDHLLVVDEAKSLTATNLVTGEIRQTGISNVSDIHHAGRVNENLALVTADPSSLVLLDVDSGEIFSRIRTVPRRTNLRGAWNPPEIFRRAGLLYVAVSVRDWRAQLPRTVFDEPQTGAGTLICIDPKSGQDLWQRPCETIAIPPVYGAPCPFLVTWSTSRPQRRQLGGFNNYEQPTLLTVTVLDALTGATVGETQRRGMGVPLRVTHDAAQRQLNFTFSDNVIHMNYAK